MKHTHPKILWQTSPLPRALLIEFYVRHIPGPCRPLCFHSTLVGSVTSFMKARLTTLASEYIRLCGIRCVIGVGSMTLSEPLVTLIPMYPHLLCPAVGNPESVDNVQEKVCRATTHRVFLIVHSHTLHWPWGDTICHNVLVGCNKDARQRSPWFSDHISKTAHLLIHLLQLTILSCSL